MGRVLGDTGAYEFRRAVRARTRQGMATKPCRRYAEEIIELLVINVLRPRPRQRWTTKRRRRMAG